MLDEFDMTTLLQYTVRTYDYIPQDVRPAFRTAYYAILFLLNGIPADLEPDSDPEEADNQGEFPDGIRFLRYRLHQIRVCLPALLLPYDSRTGTLSRLAQIQTNCKLFLAGKWSVLYRDAIKILSKGAITLSPRTAEQLNENTYKQVRSLCQKGNVGKASRRLAQAGYVTEDPIDKLRAKHPHSKSPDLSEHEASGLIQQIRDSVDWDKTVSAQAFHRMLNAKKGGRAPDRYGLRMREHLKIVMEKPQNSDLYMSLVLLPIAQGTFDPGLLSVSVGAQLFAAPKPNNDVRPIQNPDADRIFAAGLVCHSVCRTDQAIQYFEHGNHGINADARISQRGMSKNGTEWVAREVQRELEKHDALLRVICQCPAGPG
jgi:hypothetical protein